MQSAFSWAPKVARKCESKHWYACGADGRSVGRSRDYQIFWDGYIYLPMVLRWRALRAELRYNYLFLMLYSQAGLKKVAEFPMMGHKPVTCLHQIIAVTKSLYSW